MAMGKSLRFQSFILDLERLSLHGPSGQIDLRPKSFEVLRYLVEHAGRVVTKDEVIKGIWPDVVVTDESLTRCISEVRQAIADEDQEIIKTVPRRGYLFEIVEAPVQSHSGAAAPEQRGAMAGTAAPPPHVRPSLAVLPFINISGDPEQEYFSDGITEDIITDLSKVSGLFVVARHSTFTYKGKRVKVQDVGRDLNVKFILEGSVRKAGARVRVTAQLVHGESGGHLWADRYDRDLTDIFAIQDEITRTIVNQLKVKLLPEESEVIGRAPTENLEAYAYYLRGRQFLHRHSKPYYLLAKRMFAKAVELDAFYARAYAGISDCDSFLFLHYNEDVSIDGILATTAKALDLQSGLAEAHASRGLALSVRERYPEALAEFNQAIELDPNLFEAHYFYARACYTQGKLEEAAVHFGRAADLKPDDYQALLVGTAVYRALGREQEMKAAAREGVARAERALAAHPENPRSAYLGAIGLAILGEFDRAKDWAARALVIDPDDRLAKYNVACFYSIVGEHERAIDLLIELLPGSTHETKKWVRYDSDLDPIRSHQRFAKVLTLLK